MIIDAECLRDAKVENLERLARALKIRLPRQKRGVQYSRALVRELLRGLERDAKRTKQAA